ncbi:unnamed protein product [Microthlaspi erraticum]|uniref:HMA domain-containing protein n=1 Tax=Microthlaspi erraticum TaxID=1685480 RepID=A0A6D2HLQ0_9BRAS|nr:unnamed protein product [Microthlaspi erraticum]
MDYAVDMSVVMKVNRNCDYCRQKVGEMMQCLHELYSVDFLGDDNTVKIKARANPGLLLMVIERYGDHGKVSEIHLDGKLMTPLPGGGFSGHSGVFLPPNPAANYPYPSPYPPPHPQYFAGNCAYSMSSINQHTQSLPLPIQPPPPRPFYSYTYIEPPYWPTSSSSGAGCVIM